MNYFVVYPWRSLLSTAEDHSTNYRVVKVSKCKFQLIVSLCLMVVFYSNFRFEKERKKTCI